MLYCISWNYKGNFINLKKYVEQEAPEVVITGGEYPAPFEKQVISKVIGFLSMGFILVLLFGEKLIEQVAAEPPAFVKRMYENKWTWVFLVYIISSNISNMLLSSGAFEIYLNDNLYYSKLHTGQMPSGEVLQQLVKDVATLKWTNHSSNWQCPLPKFIPEWVYLNTKGPPMIHLIWRVR